MISLTKLLCGNATAAEASQQGSASDRPLVVWNATYRCNLRCAHCYVDARARSGQDELTSEQALAMIGDLAAMRVPVLLFAGGEPLVRKDTLGLARHAIERGLRPVLATNGTLIDRPMALRLKAAGFHYAGVSLDGLEETHDRLRRQAGAFRAAIEGIRNCNAAGVKAGVRFTLNALNFQDLADLLDLMEELAVPRFCLYHLVYSGRGKRLMAQDATPEQRRAAVGLLIERVLDWERRGVEIEVLTSGQHADGAFLLGYVARELPERAAAVRQALETHGGCSAGCRLANVDPLGYVHPCQFWGHVTLGNVKARKLSEIWRDAGNDALLPLRRRGDYLKGRCGECAHRETCGGCRVRAEAVFGDPWAEDPACYLTAGERAGMCPVALAPAV